MSLLLKRALCFLMISSIFYSEAKPEIKISSESIYIGPEIYYLQRTKKEGGKQNGPLYGFRAGYDRVKRYKVYTGVEFLWAKGTVKGHRDQDRLESRFTDMNIEGRLGYTFARKCWPHAWFTPFIGIGYFWENNHFTRPSSMKIRFDNTFPYIPVGFLSGIYLTKNFTVGLNFKVRFLWDGKMHISHDPKHRNCTQGYNEKLQYRAELPFTYFFPQTCKRTALCVEPFCEYRHYGHQINFPFDFLETKYRIYGATVKILYLF